MIKDYYEDTYNYDYIDLGQQIVEVNKIIGLTDSRVDEYNDDWTPKDKDDSRWIYQKELVENGGDMLPVHLILMPNGYYIVGADGNHRVSVAHVLGLKTIQAQVYQMISKDEGIDDKWQEYAKEDIAKLDNLSLEYQDLMRQLPKVQDESFKSGDDTKEKEIMKRLDGLSDEIDKLDNELRDEEKSFKQNLLKK